jgi:hypothetical protein
MNTLRLLLVASAALVLVSAAHAAYPGTYAQGGVVGAVSVSPSRTDTVLTAGERTMTLDGAFGIPTMITSNTPLGLSPNSSQLVLQSIANQHRTQFVVVRTRDLHVTQTIDLAGSYAFDALSPNGNRLYLIQHRSADLEHYIVRAYDLGAGRLLAGRIADKTQRSWVMQGYPASRAVTSSGRWVYTLYSNPGGFPFVHALDTVKGVAHCVGIAWSGDQNPLYRYRLAIDGNRLLVRRPDASVYRAIDRTTWAVQAR